MTATKEKYNWEDHPEIDPLDGKGHLLASVGLDLHKMLDDKIYVTSEERAKLLMEAWPDADIVAKQILKLQEDEQV